MIFNTINKLVFKFNLVAFVILISGVISLPAFAVGISTVRIYLDNTQSEQNFVVYNKEAKRQECELLIRHFDIIGNGEVQPYIGDDIPKSSAESWIRFSPKQFVLEGFQSQSVRFRFRRKPNAEAAEFRSFLAVDCMADKNELVNEDVQYGLLPRLRHNIPIIVRTGNLDASVEFTDIGMASDTVEFSIVRQGTRSVYGHLALIDTRTNEIVSENTHFVIYPETQKKSYALAAKGVKAEYLSLQFVENKKEGGSIDYIQKVQ